MQQDKYKVFFQKTGKILFAIAMADKKIMPQEYEALESLIQEEFKTSNLKENEIKHINQLKNVFDWMIDNPKSSDAILAEYKEFKNENKALFTPEIKDFIFKTANRIAGSFANKNKSELIVLGKLHLILKG
jgi:hypothetical protein